MVNWRPSDTVLKSIAGSALASFLVLTVFRVYPVPQNTVHPEQAPVIKQITPQGLCYDDWQDFVDTYRLCLKSKFRRMTPNEIFRQFINVVDQCKGNQMGTFLNVQYLQNGDERKFLIPFLRTAPSRNCTEVTLGVGNDVMAEQKLAKIYPKCKMFGADPALDAGTPFKSVGEYFQIAVSNVSGNSTNLLNFGGGYYPKVVPTITLMDFLKNHVNRTFIDHLWVDNEGPEYGITPQFDRNGPIDRAGITICQMNMEFHENIAAKDGFLWFSQFMPKIVETSKMIPLMAAQAFGNNRVLFVNVEHKMCIAKYFARYCGL